MPLNDWTRTFLSDPLGLLRQVSISPPDGFVAKQRLVDRGQGALPAILYDAGMSAASSIKMDGAFLGLFDARHRRAVAATADKFKAAEVNVPVGMMKLEMDSVGSKDIRHQLASALTFKVDLASQDEMRDEMAKTSVALEEFNRTSPAAVDSISWAHKDKIPIYFLPWQSHQLVSITIPEYTEENVVSYGRDPKTVLHGAGLVENRKPRDLEIDPLSPHIFFTAAINGCSVFVTGSPRSPTITHAGISQDSTPYGTEAELFWRDLLTAHNAAQNVGAGRVAEVNRKDYITGHGGTTWLATRYKTYLDRLPSNAGLKVELVRPWGAVFGIRYGRMWSFYLQENALVERYIVRRGTKTIKQQRQVTQTNFFGRPTGAMVAEDVEVEVQVDERFSAPTNVPMRVTPFFPKGAAIARPRPTFRVVV